MAQTTIYAEEGKAQKLLSIASLFEGDFSIDWLLELSELKVSTILSILENSVTSGDLSKVGSGQFRFRDEKRRHSLFNTFSSKQREKLHYRAVQIIRQETGGTQDHIHQLAKHLLHIPNDIDGCQLLIEAGDLYAKSIRYKEATECYSKAIRDLTGINQKSTDRLFIETVNKYMNMFAVRSESKFTTSILKNALSRAEAIDDKAFLCILNLHLAINQWQRTYYRAAEAYFEKGWALAQQLPESTFTQSINTIGAYFYYLQGRFRIAVRIYEKSFKGVEKFPESMSLLYAVAAIGRAYAAIGQANQGLGMLSSIKKHCQKINQHQIADWAVLQMGYIFKGIGRIEYAYQLLSNLKEEDFNDYDIRMKEDYILLAALLHYWKGEPQKSVTYLNNYLQSIKENEALGMPIASYGFVLKLCWTMEQEKYPSFKDLSVEKAVAHSVASENVFYKGYGYRYKALLLRKEGKPASEMFKNLKLSLRFLEESGHRLPIARTRIEIARYYLSIGEERKARKEAKKAASTILSHSELQFPDDLRFLIKDLNIKDNLLDEILKLGQEISVIQDIEEIERHIILTVNQITGAERGAIFLLKKDNYPNEFILRAAKNLTEEEVKHPGFAFSMEVIQQVATSRKGVVKKSGNLGKLGQNQSNKISSCICVPMIFKNEITGVLYFDNRFLSSPFKKSDLKMFTFFAAQAGIAMSNARAYNEVKRLNQKLNNEKQYYKAQHLESLMVDDIIGESAAIKNVKLKMMKVANTDTTVLILGETGVGKELVAGAIIEKSARSDRPFIRVNCSTFSRGLIATELFGHEKGAFTGADKQTAGRFELADGGTLFLDEIGDIPMEVQVRLLRVLQTQEFERVGGSKTLKSDFRLIVATNRNLRKLVKEGSFREDLYYRLNVFPITVPPLRERKEDIPLLAHHFLHTFAQKANKPVKQILEPEMRKLIDYDWPGNIREMANVIERGIIMSSDSNFKVPALKPINQNVSERSNVTLSENERLHILWALEKTSWKISGPGGAADLLDINYGTLRSRMKKHGILKPNRSAL